MAQFKADVQGQAGVSGRIGSKNSGIWSHTRGWNAGIEVRGYYDATEDRDCFEVWTTSGSTGRGQKRMIGTLVDGLGFAFTA